MDRILFVLIDCMEKSYFLRYQDSLTTLHQKLLKKLSAYDCLVLGSKDSVLAERTFHNAQDLYRTIGQKAQGRDIIIADAFGALLSLQDTEKVLSYMREKHYDVCLVENLPAGLVPMTIAHDFIGAISQYIEKNQKITSSLKSLINWEYQGIDVGVYLSPSLLVMERIDFLPVHNGAIQYMLELVEKDFSLDTAESLISSHSSFFRNVPHYLTIELTGGTDKFYYKQISKEELSLDCVKKIVTEISDWIPEALISLGVWGEPLVHSQFSQIIECFREIPNPILVECRAHVLNEDLMDLVFSRPNTELIVDVSFTTEQDFQRFKKSPYTLAEVKNFLKEYPQKEHLWVRLTRAPETENHIQAFLKEWKDFMPRVLITKADSFGTRDHLVVDLAPIKRHPCYALRREMVIMNNGAVLLCKQSDEVIGVLENESLKEIWTKDTCWQKQRKNEYDCCLQCSQCDDWWIWN